MVSPFILGYVGVLEVTTYMIQFPSRSKNISMQNPNGRYISIDIDYCWIKVYNSDKQSICFYNR